MKLYSLTIRVQEYEHVVNEVNHLDLAEYTLQITEHPHNGYRSRDWMWNVLLRLPDNHPLLQPRARPERWTP